MNPIETLKELVAIDSQCNGSNQDVVEYLGKKLSKYHPRQVRFKSNDGNIDLYNLIVKIPGVSSECPLVFVGHTDTVPASGDWTRNPFYPVERDGRIYGLGASDMKAGLACMVSAALSLDKRPKTDIYLLFDADEELGLAGGEQMIKDFSAENARTIVPEPTSNQMIYAQKGCLDIEVDFKGQARHSSRADAEYNEANNALYKTTAFCEKLIRYGREIEKKRDPLLGKPTLNIGMITGGTAANVVPANARITLSRRMIPEEDIEEVYNGINGIAQEIDPEVECRPIFWGSPFQTDPNSKFIQHVSGVAKRHLGKVKSGVKAGWTEAALFSRFGDVVIFGPGIEDTCHKPDEYAEVENVNAFHNVFRELMQ